MGLDQDNLQQTPERDLHNTACLQNDPRTAAIQTFGARKIF